jgi:hypothetical protein
LLCGMEQARRPALAHHVHRTAPMGPRVLINGIWYKGLFALSATGTGLSRFRTMPGIRRRSSTLSALAPTAVQTIAPAHVPFGGFGIASWAPCDGAQNEADAIHLCVHDPPGPAGLCCGSADDDPMRK